MSPLEPTSEISESGTHWLRWGVLAAAAAAAVALFYVRENWRGKRDWEGYKRELAAQGHTLKWEAYIPAPLPDEQNIFAAPNMTAWFTGRGQTGLSVRLSSGRDTFLEQRNTNWLLEATFVSPESPIDSADVDLVLEYQDRVLGLGSLAPKKFPVTEIIPTISIDRAPLGVVITNLARQAGVRCAIDPGTGLNASQEQPLVSVTWMNLSARAALLGVLENYGLILQMDPQMHSGRVMKRPTGGSTVCTTTDASAELATLIAKASASFTNNPAEPTANSAQAFTTFIRHPPRTRPGRVIIRCEQVPTPAEVEKLFSKRVPTYFRSPEQVRAVAESTNCFHLRSSPAKYTAAADYLEWSDQLQPEFDLIREALKRPYARMNGDYSNPVNLPIPNFVVIRSFVQTMAQRAQCHLLLEQPQEALKDLELIDGVSRLLEGPPGGKPMTLVSAMIDVAVRGLYVGAVEEGLRLEAWHEAQLAAIQTQLGKVRLLPIVAAAFETERASVCQVLDTATPQQLDQWLSGSSPTTVWGRLSDPRYTLLALAPRGWLYQNSRTVALREQNTIEAFDLAKGVILPEKADALSDRLAGRTRFSLYGFLANLMPDSARALQTTARNQTLANEALVVCALERYQMARGHYPATTEELRPEFLDVIPTDIVGGSALKYRLGTNATVVVYSVGWNGKDDGGVPGTKDPTTFDLQKGDWVWPFKQRLMK